MYTLFVSCIHIIKTYNYFLKIISLLLCHCTFIESNKIIVSYLVGIQQN